MERGKQKGCTGPRSYTHISPYVLQRYKALINVVPDHCFATPLDLIAFPITEEIMITRNDFMASAQKLEMFSSSPKFPPKCELRGDWPDTNKMQIRTFRGLFGAKRLFDFWADGADIRWLNGSNIVLSTGMMIKSPQLEEIVEYKLTKEEKEYVWPEPFASEVLAFKEQRSVRSSTPKKDKDDDRPKAKTRDKVEKQPVKERTPRPSKDGLVSVADIADELKVSPRIARGVLRDSKTPKPDAGWAWPKAEAEKIKSIIKKGLK